MEGPEPDASEVGYWGGGDCSRDRSSLLASFVATPTLSSMSSSTDERPLASLVSDNVIAECRGVICEW